MSLKSILFAFLVICFLPSCKKCYYCNIPVCYTCYSYGSYYDDYCGDYPEIPKQQCISNGGTWSIKSAARSDKYCYSEVGFASVTNSIEKSSQQSACEDNGGIWVSK